MKFVETSCIIPELDNIIIGIYARDLKMSAAFLVMYELL